MSAQAATVRAGGRLLLALQRLAFAACFSHLEGLALPGRGPSSAAALTLRLKLVPEELLFDFVRRGPAFEAVRPSCRARSRGRLVPPLIHFVPDSLDIFGAFIPDAAMRPDP
jgi:hypothetical protein